MRDHKKSFARLLGTCLALLAIGGVLSAAPSAEASLVIENGAAGPEFKGSGALRIYLEQFETNAEWTIDRIECPEVALSGTVSSPLDAKAKLKKWTATNCKSYPQGYPSSTAYVTIMNLPSVEALSNKVVRFKKPASDPFKIWIEYTIDGRRCTAEVESGTLDYSYASGATNELSVKSRQFFGAGEIVMPGVCLDGGSALIESNLSFPKPQFQVSDSVPPPPTGAPPVAEMVRPASSSTPTNARLFGLITPNELPTKYYFEYGLDSLYGNKIPVSGATISTELSKKGQQVSQLVEGLKPGTTYYYRLVATNEKGTRYGVPERMFTTPVWNLKSTPNASGAYASLLFGIDCEPSSTNMCMAVGMSTNSEKVGAALAERWDGSAWALSPTATPSGSTSSKLHDVACQSASACVAVGDYGTASGTFSLVEVWNGSSWTVQPSANPAGASETSLEGVACLSASSCTAVGFGVVGGVKTAIAERWDGTKWSMQTVPTASGAKWSVLRSVDCTSASFCMAVGQYRSSEWRELAMSAAWNGSSWSLKTVSEPAGLFTSMLNDVSCTGTTAPICTAGGGWHPPTPPTGRQPMLERWNGAAWTLQASPNQSGSDETTIYGVDCTGAESTYCKAVGAWMPPPGGSLENTLAERWNGSDWSLESTPNPDPEMLTVLADVACRGNTCLAVGTSATDTWFKYTTVAQMKVDEPDSPSFAIRPASSSALSNATLGGTITPNGLSTKYHFEYGLTSSYGADVPTPEGTLSSNLFSPQSVSQTVTGLQSGTTYHFRLVATNAEGTTAGPDQTVTTPAAWGIQSTPNPAGASGSYLSDVNCEPASTSACTAVGVSTSAEADIPLAQRWNGSSWSEQTPAKKSGAAHTRLLGVDCPSTTRCIAVGNSEVLGSGPATLAELWNESKWSVQSTPVPAGASSSELKAVGCNNTAECVAVGYAVISGVRTAIAEEWNSPTWTLQTVPIPAEAQSSQLEGVDCIWSNFCVAVGRYTTSSGSTKGLAMFWNGSWSLQTLADPAEATQSTLLDVSCTTSPNACTAAGGWKDLDDENRQSTLAYRFNGSSWTLQGSPNPSDSIASVFQEVSCASATSCTAVGSWVSDSDGSSRTLSANWNGSSWSIQSTPNPSAASFSALLGASCRGTSCLGVGWSTSATGVDSTLGEAR